MSVVLLQMSMDTNKSLPAADRIAIAKATLNGSSVIPATEEIENLKQYGFYDQALDAIANIAISDEFIAQSGINFTMTEDEFKAQSKEAVGTVIQDHIKALPQDQQFPLVQKLIADPKLNIGKDEVRPVIAEYDGIKDLKSMSFYDKAVDAVTDIVVSPEFATMTEDEFKTKSTEAVQQVVKDNIQTPTTYPELSQMMKAMGATDLAEKLDLTGADFQNSLMYAIKENPDFFPYMVEKATDPSAAGSSNFLSQSLDKLFIKKNQTFDANGNPNPGTGETIPILGDPDGAHMLDPQKAQAIQNILTEIGQGDKYQNPADFQLLDKVADASSNLDDVLRTDGVTSKQVQKATRRFFDAVNAAGGNLPGMANMDFGIFLEFVTDIFTPGVGLQGALEKLPANLGLEVGSQQAADINNVFSKVGGMIEFFGGEAGSGGYGDLFMNMKNGAYDHQLGGIKDFVGAVQRSTGGATTLTHDQQMNTAATVTDVPDLQFTKVVGDELRGLATPDVGNVFDAMRKAAPADATAEINACLLYTSPSPRDRG